MLSPHGRASGVYRRPDGNLDELGPRGISATAPMDPELAGDLAGRWGRPVLDRPADHGVVVPLLLMDVRDIPVVAVCVAEATEPCVNGFERALRDAITLARAVEGLAAHRRVAFVVSAHTSAALSPAAPLSHRRDAESLDAAALAALRDDPGRLVEIAGALHEVGGACGAAPLAAFGVVLEGRAGATVHAYAHPFGVGYVVACAGDA